MITDGLEPGLFNKADVASINGLATFDASVNAASLDDGAFIRSEWQGILAGGALARKLGSAQKIEAIQVAAIDRVGTLLDGRGASIPAGASESVFTSESETNSDIASAVTKAVQADGWAIKSLHILRPFAPAVEIVVTSPTAALQTLEHFDAMVEEIRTMYSANGHQDECSLEGTYVEVDDSGGKTLVIMADDCRVSYGMSWNRPDGPIQIPHARHG